MLPHDAPLPRAPKRVLVAGTSGAGKTTFAREVARRLALPHTEIDALYHGMDWTPRPEFMADVAALAAGPSWVTEWQYTAARTLLVEHADTLIWLDYPRALIMWRVIRRTMKRALTREELWNGNREQGLWRAFTHPEGIVRWAWDTHHLTRQRVRAVLESDPELTVVRLRSPHEAQCWLAGLVQ